MALPQTPQLIIPEDKSTSDTIDTCTSSTSSIDRLTIVPPTSGTTKKKLTKILSTQASFDYHHVPYPVTKRFSIDADPSSIISHIPITDLSNSPLQKSSESELSYKTSLNKEILITRSPTLKKSDSFLEIPYEKGEIVDLIKLADDPNAAAHFTDDGNEVDAIKAEKEKSREARNAFISNRLMPGVYFAFLTACGLLGGFGFALGRTKKRETSVKLTQQANATQIFDDGQRLAVRALRRATIYSLTGVLSFSCFLWLISGRPKTFAGFREWTGSWLPSIKSKKPKEEQGRTEFKNLTELMQYLADEDQKLKSPKKESVSNVKDISS